MKQLHATSGFTAHMLCGSVLQARLGPKLWHRRVLQRPLSLKVC